jgi:predicted DNA-binding transcriptional regulator AlpA
VSANGQPHQAEQRPPVTLEELPHLIDAKISSRSSGVSEATWWRLHAAGKVPAPVKLGSRTLWRREELVAWIEAGCPSRRQWEAMRKLRR